MTVPAALTALLTMGPAYGLQLHTELGSRLPHRQSTNVGQIYSTLDRLVRDGVVIRSGETEDGLPQYELTTVGVESAHTWLAGSTITPSTSWADILDVLLAAASIPGSPVDEACDAVESCFTATERTDLDLSEQAQSHFAHAVVAAVADVRRAAKENTLPIRGYDSVRPMRGRRPKPSSAGVNEI